MAEIRFAPHAFSRMSRTGSFELLQKPGRWDSECSSKSNQIQQSDVSLAALDPADVGAVETCDLGEILLGQPGFDPNFSDSSTEPCEVPLSHHAKVSADR
jgi:hypothetical protein